MNKIFRSKNRYQVVESTNSENGISYGIISKTDPSVFVLDISSNRAFVAEINRKCNKGNLSPFHLLDVVEDSLP